MGLGSLSLGVANAAPPPPMSRDALLLLDHELRELYQADNTAAVAPRSSLSGSNLAVRDAWSQLHGRDPRSKKETAAEKQSKQTLLSWARSTIAGALDPSAARRGRI